ncbi:MAG: hypothetical protein J2O49_06545, partial [Sciscionella sp.]|nr:hypothetical protein [Sciscionella sp.]
MPTSLIVGALVVAWLVVLVPMVSRKRQAVLRTADSALAARVVRGAEVGNPGVTAQVEEAYTVADDENPPAGNDGALTVELPLPQDMAEQREHRAAVEYDEHADEAFDESGELSADAAVDHEAVDEVAADDAERGRSRRYRPGRGGFDPQAAELSKQAKYAFRRRVVLGMLIAAVFTALVAALAVPGLWLVHLTIDVAIVGYLTYLRRQVRIEEDIRQRRLARMRPARRDPHAAEYSAEYADDSDDERAVAGDQHPQPPA